MGQLVTGIAGAVIGSFTPMGAYWGWTIGVLIGTILFPPDGLDLVGPQLQDTTIQSSASGRPIPIVYGTMKATGNVIWGTEIVKKTHIEEFGKGGPSGTYVTYSYYGNFAVAVCEGEADLLRIWANGKLIYNPISLSATDEFAKPGVEVNWHRGTETQLPDAYIESFEGVGQVPGHRGLAYVVFKELPLANYGSGIPRIEVEIASNASQNPYSIIAPTVADLGNTFIPLWSRGKVIRATNNGGVTAPVDLLSIWDLNTNTVETHLPADITTLNLTTFWGIIGLTYDGNRLVFEVQDTVSLEWYFLEVSVDTWREARRTPVGTHSAFNPLHRTNKSAVKVNNDYVIAYQDWISSFDLFAERRGSVGSSTGSDDRGTLLALKHYSKHESGWYRSDRVSFEPYIDIHRFILKQAETGGQGYALEKDLYKRLNPVDLGLSFSTFSDTHRTVVDQSDGHYMILGVETTLDNQLYIKLDKDTGAVLWQTAEFDHYIENGYGVLMWSDLSYGNFKNVKTGNPLAGNLAFELNTVTGELVEDVDHGGWDVEAFTGQAYNSKSRISCIIDRAWWFDRLTAASVTLQSIVEDVCVRAGMALADIDATALSGILVPGYIIARNMQAKAALDTLFNLYLVDVAEIDDILTFVVRGGAAAGTITEQDLVVAGNDAETLIETRLTESELPIEISLTYRDPNLDYNVNIHRAKRIVLPSPETQSTNKLDLKFAGVLDPDVAKEKAMVLMLSNWEGRTSRAFTTSRSFAKYVPTDVLTMTLDDGRTVRTRLANSELRKNLDYELSAYDEDSGQYSFPSTADGGEGHVPQVIDDRADVQVVPIASTLWKDSHANGRVASQWYYYLLPSGGGVFDLGILYESPDDTNYVQIGAGANQPTWGYAVGTLPDVPFDEKWQIDYTNTLRVNLINEGVTLSSVTMDQMLVGTTNAFALIDKDGGVELMKFQDVVDEGGGEFSLTGLCRGRRGTDRFMDNHTGGDLFIMLDTNAGISTTELGDVGAQRWLKAVAPGDVLEDTVADPFTNNANDLKPWAPVWIESDGALWGTDIDLSWVRRTRHSGPLRNLSGNVPLNEDSELYDVEIYDGATLERTFTDLTTPAVTYTSAQQTADAWSGTPTEISVIAYQKSAQVGRGFASHITVIQV